MSPGTPAWARVLVLIAAIGLAFFLSAVAAFFLGSLLSGEPVPPRDENSIVIEETTRATTNEETTWPTTEEMTKPPAAPADQYDRKRGG
jgi:hypothetical protein